MSTERQLHPEYKEYAPDWRKIRLAQKGERFIRDAGDDYLPKTEGMKNKTIKNAENEGVLVSAGTTRYKAYKERARFYPVVDDFVDGVMGIAFEKPLETNADINEIVTNNNISLSSLVQQIIENVSLVGRHILVVDKNANDDP